MAELLDKDGQWSHCENMALRTGCLSGCVLGGCGASCPHGSLSFSQAALGMVVFWLFLILENDIQAEALNPEQIPEGEGET